jgi:hypothetical protein
MGVPDTGLHVPTLPIKAHASHCPLHGLLQHTASTQYPDLHWLVALQVAPGSDFGLHMPAEQ